MSNKNSEPQILSDHGKYIVFEAIKNSTVRYTNESDDSFIRHSYYIDCPNVYISTIKVADKKHKQPTKFMLNIKFKEYECSASDSKDFAKRIYTDLREKYIQAIQRTRLTRNFQNPSFARAQKIKG